MFESRSVNLNIIEVYVECCEWFSYSSVSSWQSAESLCSVGLHGLVGHQATTDRATELSSLSKGQAPDLRHTQPGKSKNNFNTTRHYWPDA